MDLAVGETAFKVKVTSGTDTETYTVTVERDCTARISSAGLRAGTSMPWRLQVNANPQGHVVHTLTTMWVADDEDNKLYAYTLATGASRFQQGHQPAHHGNGSSKGIWSNGTTIWVADDEDDKLYAYALSDGTRQDGTNSTTTKSSACTPTTATLQASGPTGQRSGLPTMAIPRPLPTRSSPTH